jgi:hypothetical protein
VGFRLFEVERNGFIPLSPRKEGFPFLKRRIPAEYVELSSPLWPFYPRIVPNRAGLPLPKIVNPPRTPTGKETGAFAALRGVDRNYV